MDDETHGEVDEHASDEAGEEVQRGGERGGILHFLEVERGENLEGVHDAAGERNHDACRAKRDVFPEPVWDECGAAGAGLEVHPDGEGNDQYEADGEEGGCLG